MEQKWQIWDKLIFSPGMRNIGTHVHNFREVNSCCDFLVQSRRVLKPNRGKWIGGHPTTLLRTGWPKDRVQKMSPFQVEGQRQSFPYVQKKFKFYLFKWKEATTGSFCIVSCFVLSWWELHLLHLGSISCMMSRHLKIPGYLDIISGSHTWFWTWSQGVQPGWTCSGKSPRR